MEVLAKRLKWLREKKRLAQKEIAAELGVSLNAYQKWEYANRDPKLEVIVKMSKYLNATTDFLLGNSSMTEELEHIPLEAYALKQEMDKIKEDASYLMSDIMELREEMVEYGHKKGIADAETILISGKLDEVIKKKIDMDSMASELSKQIGSKVYQYLEKILEIPYSNPSNDKFLQQFMPFDIAIQPDLFEEYSLILYGKGLGIISVLDAYPTEEEAQKAKNEFLKRMYVSA